MSKDTIPLRLNGQVIVSDWFNVIQRALRGDVLPRNASGIIEDQAGSIGSTSYTWGDLFLNRLRLLSGGNHITVQALASVASSFTIKLLASLPGSIKNFAIDDVGQITSEDLTNYFLSADCGAGFSTTNAAETLITNQSGSLTTKGNPVYIRTLGGNNAVTGSQYNTGATAVTFNLYRDSTKIATWSTTLGGDNRNTRPLELFMLDTPAAGTYTYSLKVVTTGSSVTIRFCKLFAMELRG